MFGGAFRVVCDVGIGARSVAPAGDRVG
jgi:hypothetical protein